MLTAKEFRERLARAVGGEESLAHGFSARTMRDPKERAARELDSGVAGAFDALEWIDKALEEAGFTGHAEADRQAFLERYARAWAAYQLAGGRTASAMVVGPANFPAERNRKRMDTEMRRMAELLELSKAAPGRAVKAAERAHKASLGVAGVANAELEDLRARLAKREAAQERMKETNAIIRKHKFGEGDERSLAARLSEAGHVYDLPLAAALLKPPYASAPAGYASFQLTNNLAEIKRLRIRVAEVERKAARIEAAPAEPSSRSINGVELIEDAADDRLRLIFDGKPSPATIASLKGRGFRWSPRAGAWQRQLTANARAAAEAILAQLEPEPA